MDALGFSITSSLVPKAFGMRRSAQVLRRFGKQWEAKLPTYALIINENVQNCAIKKISRIPDGKQTGGDKK